MTFPSNPHFPVLRPPKNNEKLEAVKTHKTDIKRIEVVESLSKNPDLVISSSSNDEVNAMMMCDAVLTSVQPGKPLNRSQVCTNTEARPFVVFVVVVPMV